MRDRFIVSYIFDWNKALNDINLCQRLFFLLRSFVGEFEEHRTLPNSLASSEEGNFTDESTHALKCCRYAQRRLSARMFDKAAELHGGSGGYPINRESTTSSRIKQHQKRVDFSQLSISPSEGSIGTNCRGLPPTTTTTAKSPSWDSRGCPYRGLDSPSTSSLDNIEVADIGSRILLKQTFSDALPGSPAGSSRENHDNNVTTSEKEQKKTKSSKILGIFRGSGKSIRGSKKPPSDKFHTGVPNNGTTLGAGDTSCNSGNTSKKSPRNISAFLFSNVFLKQQASSQAVNCIPPPPPPTGSSPLYYTAAEQTSLSVKFENMAWILRQLDNSCSTIERNLMKTFRQKMADWALSSWSASKENALASVTQGFRSELELMNPSSSSKGGHGPNNNDIAVLSSTGARFPIVNPVDPSELLTSIDADESFILPSAHFPLLLCFNTEQRAIGSPRSGRPNLTSSPQRGEGDGNGGGDILYRTVIEILGLRSHDSTLKIKDAFIFQGAVAGVVQESGVR